MEEEHPIWSYSGLDNDELRQILSNPNHEEFVHLAARLLASSLDVKQVFNYLDKKDFIQHYSRIRKSMGEGAQARRHKKFWDRMAKQGRKKMGLEQGPSEEGEEKAEADYASESALNIGRRIRKLRKEEALSQAELAERLKISKSEISRIENGKQNLSIERLQRVLNGLGYKAQLEIKPLSE